MSRIVQPRLCALIYYPSQLLWDGGVVSPALSEELGLGPRDSGSIPSVALAKVAKSVWLFTRSFGSRLGILELKEALGNLSHPALLFPARSGAAPLAHPPPLAPETKRSLLSFHVTKQNLLSDSYSSTHMFMPSAEGCGGVAEGPGGPRGFATRFLSGPWSPPSVQEEAG